MCSRANWTNCHSDAEGVRKRGVRRQAGEWKVRTVLGESVGWGLGSRTQMNLPDRPGEARGASGGGLAGSWQEKRGQKSGQRPI